MKRYLLPSMLSALIAIVASGGVVRALVSAINPQQCLSPQTCVDINAQLLPTLNSASIASPLFLGVSTVAALGTTCTTAQKGNMFYVTDAAAAPVYNATVAGSGAVIIPVFCNGTNWVNH